jgi:arginase
MKKYIIINIDLYYIIILYYCKMFRNVSFNNFICKFGQKKDGVQYGGSYILSNIKKSKKTHINHININSQQDYAKGYSLIKHNHAHNRFNINLGGDHSISACTIQPLIDSYKKDLLVIWIDAHADINTYDKSLTKNLHGMPLASLCGLMKPWYTSNHYPFKKLSRQNLIYIGIRDLDNFESEYIKNKKLTHFRYFDWNIFRFIRNHPAKYIHISCDIDAMDPYICASTGTPVADGLSRYQIEYIIDFAKPRLISFDLVEFNPLIGTRSECNRTMYQIKKIIKKIK